MKLSLLCIVDTLGHTIGLDRFGWFPYLSSRYARSNASHTRVLRRP